jgi:hypothetical protein
MRENGVVEEMKGMRKEWDERRKKAKDCGVMDGEGVELNRVRNGKEMLGKEDIANVIFIEYLLIPFEERKQWVESEKIVDVIESVIQEKENEKEDLMEKDCVNGDSLLCHILWFLIDYSDVSVESVVCLSRRMLLQQISLLCSDPHSSFTRQQCFYLTATLVQNASNESMKMMHSMGLLKCVEIRVSEKKERNNKVLNSAVGSLLDLLKKRKKERETEEEEEEIWKDIMGSFESDVLEESVCAGTSHISRIVTEQYSHVGEEIGLWKEIW